MPKKVYMLTTFYWYFVSVTGIEDIPDPFFPVVQADITECSTYAAVCRLKTSPTYTITPAGGSFSHPDFPGVMLTVPENAVAPETAFSLVLKVSVITKLHT